LEGNSDDALSILKEGLSKEPDSAHLSLLVARILYQSGNYGEAEVYYRRVETASKRLTSRYSYLTEAPAAAGSGGRAGIEAGEEELIWLE